MSPSQDKANRYLQTVEMAGIDGRVAIEFLARPGIFLFHGSERGDISVLRPRRPMIFDDGIGSMRRIPQRGIFATDDVNLAIFHALTRMEKVRDQLSLYVTGFETSQRETVRLFASADVITNAADPHREAWVYVVPRRGFKRVRPAIYALSRPVRPLLRIRITGTDAPTGILIEPVPLTRRGTRA